MFDAKRRTGRTTRMVREAERLVSENEGRRVIIRVNDLNQVHYVRSLIDNKFKNIIRIEVYFSDDGRYDDPTRSYSGDIVLVDHLVIEQMITRQFSRIFNLWTRWDEPNEQ